MIRRKKDAGPRKTKRDFVELLTGRIAKITGLATAVGGLAVVIVSLKGPISELIPKPGGGDDSTCLRADGLVVPATVKYSEWENMVIELTGHNSCSIPRGVYVAFESPPDRGLFLRVPAECRGHSAWQKSECWEPKKPVPTGDWRMTFLPPPLEPARDLRSVEKIKINWRVFDYDAPSTIPVLLTNSTTIDVENDIATLH